MSITHDNNNLQSEQAQERTKADPESDRLLFKKIAASDEAAFQQLFHSYNRSLFPFVLSITKNEADAKEVIQDIFLKVWLKRETLTTIDNPGGWLYTVAANTAYEHLRKEARYTLHLQKVASRALASDPNLEDIHEQFDTKEVKALIAEAVDKLPLRRRQIFRMARLEGFSRREIAEILGISENTVRNQLTEAAEFIQDYMRRNGPLYLPVLLILGFSC